MRALTLGLSLLLAPTFALAADYGGPAEPPSFKSRVHDWSGFYLGGQGGYTNQKLDATPGVLSDPAGNNPALTFPFPPASGNTGSYGAFMGYSAQWEDIVLSAEVNYNRLSKGLSASSTFGTTYTFDPVVGPVPATATGTSTTRITDMFGARLRAGWATGWMMPYATVGVVVARGEATRTGVVTDGVNVVAGQLATTSATPFGFSAGLGIDMAITSNIFARAEIEYVGLRESKGISAQFTTFRAGLGYKF